MRRKSNGFYAIVLFFGGIFSSAIGDIIAALMPGGVVKQFFLRHLIDFQFGPATLDINIISFTLGFGNSRIGLSVTLDGLTFFLAKLFGNRTFICILM